MTKRLRNVTALAAALCLGVGTSALSQQPDSNRAIVVAQGAFSFGKPDDLGPRYEPYSERWDQYKPPETYTCRLINVREPQPDGRMVLRRQRVCGFRVPARN